MEHPVAFGRYQLVRRIAQGGMAEIYLTKLVGAAGVEKTLALKRIHNKHTEEARFLELFINEGRISASLSHSNIVAVYDFGRVGDEYYLAMEYVPGRDIAAVLRAIKGQSVYLPWGLVLYIGTQILTGLSYLHRRHKVTHGDITPRNVLLSQEGEVKLADFGVARVGQAFEGKLRGTIPYMSPEQANKQSTDPRSDLFSVALVLAEMLQGAPIYAIEEPSALLSRVRRADVGDIHPQDPNTPRELITILQRALSLQIEDRFASADELLGALDELASQARETKSPYTAVGLSLFLQTYAASELHPNERAELQGSDKPAQSFVEAGSDLSDIRTQTSDIPEAPQLFSTETPLATQSIALPEAPQNKRRQLFAAGATVAALSGFLLVLHNFVQPQPTINPTTPATVPSQVFAAASQPTQPSSVPAIPSTLQAVPTSAPSSLPTLLPHKKNEAKPKKVGYLSVSAYPWANIEIDGRAKGEAPLTRIALPPGKHIIKAHHPVMNRTQTYSVTIEEGAETSKHFVFGQ